VVPNIHTQNRLKRTEKTKIGKSDGFGRGRGFLKLTYRKKSNDGGANISWYLDVPEDDRGTKLFSCADQFHGSTQEKKNSSRREEEEEEEKGSVFLVLEENKTFLGERGLALICGH
jgi:hypothetical protein